jgi:hypothetical protein
MAEHTIVFQPITVWNVYMKDTSLANKTQYTIPTSYESTGNRTHLLKLYNAFSYEWFI